VQAATGSWDFSCVESNIGPAFPEVVSLHPSNPCPTLWLIGR
jgi:hypothetical protein